MVAWRTNCPPPLPLRRQFKILYSVAWIKIRSHVDNQEIYLFCQNNDIKVRIFRTDFFSVGFWWSQSLLLMHVYRLAHIKNNLNPLWVEVDNTILQEDLWGMEPPATEVYGGTLLVLLGRTAEKHFAGWGAVPPGDTSQFAVTTLPPVVCRQWKWQVPMSSWSSFKLPVLATVMYWKQKNSPTWRVLQDPGKKLW